MQAIRPLRALLAPASLILAGALAGCQPANEGNADGGHRAAEPVVNLPAVALSTPPMDRETLLLAVAKAASARASGIDDGNTQRDLDGQPFEFRVRFGCDGPAKELRSVSLGWSYQPENETLRLRALPTITGDDAIAGKIDGKAVEAIEGFWVPRPWLLRATCPDPKMPLAPPKTVTEGSSSHDVQSLRGPKVGIAQFFTAADARTTRRDSRAYEAFKTVKRGTPVGLQGFNLVLAGRLRPVPGKRVIECLAESSDVPLDCIVSAHIDEVRMEKPADGSVLARWSS